METEIIIALILTIFILLFIGLRQRSTFHEKEEFHETQMQQMARSFAAERKSFIKKEIRLNDTVVRFQNGWSQQEGVFHRKIEQHRQVVQRLQTAIRDEINLQAAAEADREEYRQERQRLQTAIRDEINLQAAAEADREEYRQERQRLQPALRQKTENPNEPPELCHENPYWTELSIWYRKKQDWICENCGIHLSSRKVFLDTHHIRGRVYNSPDDLKALCIKCHSDQTQPVDHSFMKESSRYQNFMRWRGNTL